MGLWKHRMSSIDRITLQSEFRLKKRFLVSLHSIPNFCLFSFYLFNDIANFWLVRFLFLLHHHHHAVRFSFPSSRRDLLEDNVSEDEYWKEVDKYAWKTHCRATPSSEYRWTFYIKKSFLFNSSSNTRWRTTEQFRFRRLLQNGKWSIKNLSSKSSTTSVRENKENFCSVFLSVILTMKRFLGDRVSNTCSCL